MAETVNMFEKASRLKLRFQSANGRVSTEDLWDLPLSQLDVMAKGLRRELRETEDSFIEDKKSDAQIELRFEIIKYVIEQKLAERDAKLQAKERAQRRQVLQEALEKKQIAALDGMSVADIKKELAALDA